MNVRFSVFIFVSMMLFIVALRRHWPHYLAEAAGLGTFVFSSGLVATLVLHPASPLRAALPDHDVARRAVMGLCMGLVVVALTYTPWGRRSGAHINPAATLAFWQLGTIRAADAVWYVLAQTAGALAGAGLAKKLLGEWYAHPTVHYNLTQPVPLPTGTAWALGAEFGISFGLLWMLLWVLHSAAWQSKAGWLVGGLIAAYIVFEAPYSGMSLNPARSLGTAVAAGRYHGLWVYFVAPPLAMWLAAVLFRRWHRTYGTGRAAPPHHPNPHATD